jgi:SAM-dependent methyltransferase
MTLTARATGALLLTALLAMVASAAVVVPSGLTLNPADAAAALAAVHDKPGLHVLELALDVLGWLALTTAGLLSAADSPGTVPGRVAAGLLAAAGLAGLLHDAGNLSVTRLAADPHDPTAVAGAGALLLTATWMVNQAGLFWVAATVAMLRAGAGPRRAGAAAAICGLAAVVLPWTTGPAGPSPALEQAGYALHLPVMLWWGAVAWRRLRAGWNYDFAVAGNLGELRDDWTRLGAEDPLWAVYVAPGTRGGGWDVDAFFALGDDEVRRALAGLDRLGLSPGRKVALDFGCGVGRLSAALARHFAEVVAVDIAPTMLAEAKRLDRSDGRCRFVLNESDDLAFLPDGSVDLVYSSLVLQHLHPDLTTRYLREFARVLADDGVAIFQVASRPTVSLKGLAFRFAPWPLIRWAQRRLLGYPAPMRMSALSRSAVEAALGPTGARIVDRVRDDSYGGHWHYDRYYVAVDRRTP